MSKHQMTVADLKAKVDALGSPFFSRDTMRFFGDRIGNYGVRPKPVTLTCMDGEPCLVWELYRRRPVKHGLQLPAYFCVGTFKQRHEAIK